MTTKFISTKIIIVLFLKKWKRAERIFFCQAPRFLSCRPAGVNKYTKGEGCYLVLNDGSTVNVSASRKKLLLAKLQPGKM